MALPPAYSFRLCTELIATAGYGADFFPPLGYKWLVTDLWVYIPANIATTYFFLHDTASGLPTHGALFAGGGAIQNTYHAETSFVIEESSGMTMLVNEPGTIWSASGKQLSTA